MTYSQFIAKLRAEVKDLANPMHNDFTGDAATTQFKVSDAPVLEGSYTVKVGGVTKDEGADFSVDRELGLFTFVTAPGNAVAVTIDFKYVHLSNASWLQIINEIIQDMEGEFWREVVDETWDTSEVNTLAYPAPTKCIDVINAWFRTSDTASLNWTQLIEYANWKYSKELNQVLLGRGFNSAGYPLKIDYLKGFTLGTATTDTVDFPDAYEIVLKLGCQWRFYDYRLAQRVEITSKLAEERTITPLQNIQALSAHYYKLYLKEKGRKKPAKPTKRLNAYNAQGGTP